MRPGERNISLLSFSFCLLLLISSGASSIVHGAVPQVAQSQDTTRRSMLKLDDIPSVPWDKKSQSPFYLNMPSNYREQVIYDPEKNEYVIYRKVGDLDYRLPVRMSPADFRKYEYDRAMRDYWASRVMGQEGAYRSGLIPQIELGGEAFDKVFGSNVINIVPQGSAELIFGINVSHTENPALSERLRTIPTFDFQQKIQMNVTGSIGDKMQLGINYNTDAMFEFENRTKLEYSGKEDEILKKVEAGDVTLPLPGTLITGSYSLFGLKTEMQFGKLTVTTVASQQKGESQVIDVRGGAQLQEFEIRADEYEANKHFFLSQYFRDTYDESLKTLPLVSSGINIERIEIWITNKTSRFDEASNRNILAFMDLAENEAHIYNEVPVFQALPGSAPYPDNVANQLYERILSDYSGVRNIDQATATLEPLYPGFQIGRDYEKIENARRLNEREYTVNRQLGYISLNIALNSDEVLAVAYEYTIGGKVYKVGELSTDGISAPDALVLKLLKGTTLSPRLPTWNLMMKNIYTLGSGRIESRDFDLHILYQDDATGNAVNYMPEGNLSEQILLQVLRLDNLNSQLDREPDGVFDFIEEITVSSNRGRIIFPVLEPFGSYLESKITDPRVAAKYVFRELYDSTQTVAKQIAEKNKFLLRGEYSSSSGSEIRLNVANIPQGAVKVTAGGVPLTENIDYTVDYFGGAVNIINSALIESQTPIQVSLESNQFFGFQTKTLVGTHLDYRISNNFNVGATILHLNERPYTQKVNFGEEPISNTILGLNTSYRTESRLLTRAIDKLPFIETKAPSSVNFFGEVARLYPGHSRAISNAGNSYIDDFEASEIPLDIKSFHAWVMASIPQGQNLMFPEAQLNNDISSGFNRARISWYVVDPLFLRNGSATPDHIKADPDLQSSHFVREIFETEIFPFKESPSGIPTNIAVLNVAYYPFERGPYNFDTWPGSYSAGISPEGLLNNPASRWGGIMREIITSDFEAANIQYIKFWLMDPFVENSTHTGGDLFFNLGNISEDILKDSRKSFEHGLPGSPDIKNVDTTAWGRVPTIQAVVHAFDNDPEARRYQDVGVDGLSNSDEAAFFADFLQQAGLIVQPEVLENLFRDPSGDDFRYFRGSEYDRLQTGILERYKRYNGMEGNSPTSEMSQESYPTTGSTMPDMEDINRDNTLSETESYYQYRVSLRPEDMVVGSNYIVDEIEYTATLANGDKSPVKWYQFKVPITDYERIVGPIRDFKSIRFVRMFLRDFDEEVILRFAKLDLVRAEWRKYNISFMEGGERITTPEPVDPSFDISSVSIEENAGKEPVNYVLPPGFDRVVDPQNPQLRQLNEQSMVLKVQALEDGDARAAFKNVSLDVRQYRRLRMEVHGEALIGEPLQDGELTVFIRIGSDYKGNFYEYEIPLRLTPPGRYSNDNDAQRAIVWPDENAFNIDLSVFQEAKQARNREMAEPGSSLSVSDVYVFPYGEHRISVSGNPNLSNVRVIMVGIRNPIKTRGISFDDGLPKSGEVWINELRLSDFVEDGGWAANAHLQTRLADLGSIDFVGQTSTPGWGSIDKKVNERSKENVIRYDASSNIELGRFFPEKAGVRLPVYMGYSESRIKPQYNPLDPDIPLDVALREAATKEERDSIRSISEDFSRRKTLTVSNAGITARGEKPRPWDIANLSVNYTYSEIYQSDIKTEIDLEKMYRGGINYDYSATPKNIAPFGSIKLFNSQVFRAIKDFNFYLFPRSISIRSDISRFYNERKTRNISNPFLKVTPTFRKDFEWTRYYDVKYDVTRQLKVDFTATNIARIDEPAGGVDRDRYTYNYSVWRDSVMKNLAGFGRTVNYNHFINVNYNLPINKLPLLTWMTGNLRYGTNYNWLAGPLFADSLNINLGNTIKNRSDLNLTIQGNFSTLYGKSDFLKKIENNTRPGAPKPNAGIETVAYTRDNNTFRAGQRRFVVHNLRTRDVTVKMMKADGSQLNGRLEILSESRVAFTANEDAENVRVIVEGRIARKRNPFIIGGEYFLRALMGIRNINITYRTEDGQILPGYLPGTEFFGSTRTGDILSPGFGFITGYHDRDFFDKAAAYGWLTTDTLLNIPAVSTSATTLTLRSQVEPFPGFRIDLNAERRFAESVSSYYRADRYGNFPDSTRNRVFSGNFSISIISWGSAFEKIDKETDYVSPAFEAFRNNTVIISRRQAEARQGFDQLYDPDTDPVTGLPMEGDYKSGYGLTSREVLIPAFFAAYTRGDPEKVPLDPFPSVLHMMPNWRINFDGLSRFALVQKVFTSINLNHQYRSTYTIGSYTTNLAYDIGDDGVNRIRDLQNNYIPAFDINIITISEQFSPLINVDMNWKNSLTTRVELKKSRTVSLNLSSNQIADIRNDEFVVGVGYRFSDVEIVVRSAGVQRPLKSDLTVRFDLAFRDNKTMARKLIESVNQPVAGQKMLRVGATADYVLSDRFNLQIFADHTRNNPFVANTFPTSNTNAGFSLRFTLVQ
ncbi:MAG: cell surface protein SprA [Bacteroidales bacterium]|nr:cell surface protein SprA [Bacteroidales bacterium]